MFRDSGLRFFSRFSLRFTFRLFLSRLGIVKACFHSTLAAPKIRASMMRSIIKPSHRATHCCAFWSRILFKDFGSWEFHFLRKQHLNKDFLQRFLAQLLKKSCPPWIKKSVSSVCSVDIYPMIR